MNALRNLNDAVISFWDRVVKTDTCWVWSGCVSGNGYGNFAWGRKQWMPHRFSYLIHKGDPKGSLILHSCDNRLCVNPEHLSLGTYTDNNRDAVSKGRHSHGVGRPDAKLTDDKVRVIKQRLLLGESPEQIAPDYFVSAMCIRHIKNGRNWKHIT